MMHDEVEHWRGPTSSQCSMLLVLMICGCLCAALCASAQARPTLIVSPCALVQLDCDRGFVFRRHS